MARQQSNNELAISIATLQADVQAIKDSQDDNRELYMGYFKHITEKLDVMPTIQIAMSGMAEKLNNHLMADDIFHTSIRNSILIDSADIKSLQKESWMRHGASAAMGAASGLLSALGGMTFFHK